MKKWLGLGLIVFALCFIPLMALVPLMPLSVGQKAAFIVALGVLGQILTWTGIFLAGKEVVARYKRMFNPKNWFFKKPPGAQG